MKNAAITYILKPNASGLIYVFHNKFEDDGCFFVVGLRVLRPIILYFFNLKLLYDTLHFEGYSTLKIITVAL